MTAAASATSCRPARAGTTTRSSSPASWRPARRSRTAATSSAMYRDLVYATPGLTAAQIPSFFKDSSFGVRAGRRRAHLLAAVRRDDRARQGLRRPARVRGDARRRDVRPRLRRRRGPAVLHGRAAPRRARAAVELRRRLLRRDGRRAVGGRPVHGGRPHAPGGAGPGRARPAGRDPAPGQRQLHRRHQPVHRRGEARPDEAAGRVRRDRAAAGAGPVEARGPDRHRVAGRRHLRARRRQRARVVGGGDRARQAVRPPRRARVPRLPRRRGPAPRR